MFKLYEIQLLTTPAKVLPEIENASAKEFPAGTICGTDSRGFFACVSFRMKGLNSKGRPILPLYRCLSDGKWILRDEANETTDNILDIYFDNEELCSTAEQSMSIPAEKLQWYKIVKAWGVNYHGFNMPKGAIYGVDASGMPFICTDYELQPMKYVVRTNAIIMPDGTTKLEKFYSSDNCGFYKGMPRLKVWRPVAETTHQIKWQNRPEASLTTGAIFKIYMAGDFEVDYGDPAKVMAGRINNRPEFGEVHYCGNGKAWAKNMKPTTTIEYTIGFKPLGSK